MAAVTVRTVTICLPAELKVEVQRLAAEEGISLSRYIALALRDRTGLPVRLVRQGRPARQVQSNP